MYNFKVLFFPYKKIQNLKILYLIPTIALIIPTTLIADLFKIDQIEPLRIKKTLVIKKTWNVLLIYIFPVCVYSQ